jgi:hypothetical protein
VFDLLDEVFEDGDALIMRRGQLEDRVALSDIVNVNYDPRATPPRVTLSLRKPSRFGRQVAFCASQPNPLFREPIPDIEDLIKRIDAARRHA